jgi:hypothetical protein
MDVNKIEADAKSVKMGFAQEHKFYPGLESLRESQRARVRLGEGVSESIQSDLNLTLSPVVKALYPLLMELQAKSANNPVFQKEMVVYSRTYRWKSVENDDSLYSPEFKARIMGKPGKSVKTYLREERNKDQKKRVNMEKLNLRGPKRYPTVWTFDA